MSSGERKKRAVSHGGKGWEEAGGEFYQESYPGAESDLEMMQNDPRRICTLLPSKKTRCGTMKREAKLATLRHRMTMRSHYQTNVLPNNDTQIACLPDLSENLSNEKLLWEEIMKIKSMPVTMSQKRELKMKLLSRDTLRLQGFQQFKWKNKQSMTHLRSKLKGINEKLTLWRGSLKRIEGSYGSGVVSFFLFVKWLIFLNIVQSLIMSVFVIIPTFYAKRTKSFSANASSSTNDDAGPEVTVSIDVFDALIPASMNSSPLYYAFYDYFVLDFHYFKLDLPLCYILATCLCLSYSFVSVLKNASCEFKNQLLESQGQFYMYCNIVFSGWDFCIRNERSSLMKHRALYDEILGRLVAKKRREELLNRTKQELLKMIVLRLSINVFVLIAVGVADYIIFLSFQSSKLSSSTWSTTWYSKIFMELATASFIMVFNLLLPYLFRWLCRFERLDPIRATRITIFRTIALRFSTVCVLIGSVYKKQSVKTDPSQESEKDSWESYVARELYKLLVLGVIFQLVHAFFINLPRALIVKHCNNRLTRNMGKPEFYIPSHVLDIVFIQTIVWLGCFYAPLLPMIGALAIIVTFYVKKFSCLVNCKPSFDVYCSSRSHSFYVLILFISFVFSMIPWVYSIIQLQPSHKYGPFVNYNSVWSMLSQTSDKFPDWVNRTAASCISSVVLVPLLIILLLTNYYHYAVYAVNKRMVLELKQQLVLEGHDKQFLLNRLSAFIKQQQERYRRTVRVE